MVINLDNKELENHEKMAKSSFNKTWDYIDKTEDDLTMIHTAHASRYHWGVQVSEGKGTNLNLQRGEWQVTHVYTLAERTEPALYHAKVSSKLTEDNDIGDFDLAFAYEGIARASALAKKKTEYNKYYKLAEEAGKKIKDKGDREYFLGELEKEPWFGMR